MELYTLRHTYAYTRYDPETDTKLKSHFTIASRNRGTSIAASCGNELNRIWTELLWAEKHRWEDRIANANRSGAIATYVGPRNSIANHCWLTALFGIQYEAIVLSTLEMDLWI